MEQHESSRSGKSVVSVIVDFTKSIVESVDKGEKIMFFMDRSKAFDSVCLKNC